MTLRTRFSKMAAALLIGSSDGSGSTAIRPLMTACNALPKVPAVPIPRFAVPVSQFGAFAA
ncbi:MAG: hypothetical protein NVS2B4_20690 [Ramlibacter sp.]